MKKAIARVIFFGVPTGIVATIFAVDWQGALVALGFTVLLACVVVVWLWGAENK